MEYSINSFKSKFIKCTIYPPSYPLRKYNSFQQPQLIVAHSNNVSVYYNLFIIIKLCFSHSFEQMIFPFNWPYPIIYLLPESLDALFDSPVPLIMGVNKCSKVLFSDGVTDRYKDIIFVDLDN